MQKKSVSFVTHLQLFLYMDTSENHLMTASKAFCPIWKVTMFSLPVFIVMIQFCSILEVMKPQQSLGGWKVEEDGPTESGCICRSVTLNRTNLGAASLREIDSPLITDTSHFE